MEDDEERTHSSGGRRLSCSLAVTMSAHARGGVLPRPVVHDEPLLRGVECALELTAGVLTLLERVFELPHLDVVNLHRGHEVLRTRGSVCLRPVHDAPRCPLVKTRGEPLKKETQF